MTSSVKLYEKLARDDSKILLYADCKFASIEVLHNLRDCMNEAMPVIKPAVCWQEIDRKQIDAFIEYSTEDSAFRKYMANCSKAILFTATIGIGIDQLIAKYEKLSVSKAQIFQAIGTQQIEELCDTFNMEMRLEYPGSKPRYSPGYGGLDLSCQKLVFDILGCQSKIGVSLGETYLMTPSKSVTAFICIKDNSDKTKVIPDTK